MSRAGWLGPWLGSTYPAVGWTSPARSLPCSPNPCEGVVGERVGVGRREKGEGRGKGGGEVGGNGKRARKDEVLTHLKRGRERMVGVRGEG